jgi:hypothetical protein
LSGTPAVAGDVKLGLVVGEEGHGACRDVAVCPKCLPMDTREGGGI